MVLYCHIDNICKIEKKTQKTDLLHLFMQKTDLLHLFMQK